MQRRCSTRRAGRLNITRPSEKNFQTAQAANQILMMGFQAAVALFSDGCCETVCF
ncbi:MULTISPECIES: hypothetical protein [Neisseria]|uniref:hypothetical protein n=1 Tax=Neisseria TaxID=482 RepID=UPI00143025B1|nr:MULTISPECIES: hypothetical protein [Neisseria]MBF0803980.1 hypothetical protein [Neisseria sp. 19428wB4_WF04]